MNQITPDRPRPAEGLVSHPRDLPRQPSEARTTPPQARLPGVVLAFGCFLLCGARPPVHDSRRAAARPRREGPDHWIIGLSGRNPLRLRGDGGDVAMAPGIPHLLGPGCAMEAARSGAEADWIALAFPRGALPELEPALAARPWQPIEGPMGRLLAAHLAGLRAEAAALGPADLPHLAAMTRALLAGALGRDGAAAEPGRIGQMQLARVRRVIRANLGSATLDPARLARLCGMSRSALYRLFEPLGGVARQIRRERLRHVHRALADPAERRGIAALAEAAGFFDASTFSRAFRQEFGLAPRELRGSARAGEALAAPAASREGGLSAPPGFP